MGKNFCNIEHKWCKHLKHSGMCAYCGSNTDALTYCPRVKEIETVRFYDILKSVEFDNVFPLICKWYPTQANGHSDYENVFNKLISMTPKHHELTDMFLEVKKKLWDGKDEYTDVSGVDVIKNDGVAYGIEFVPWVEWISMFITQHTLDSLTYEEIAAACLYEMTYYGFEEDTIKKTKDDIVVSVVEAKKKFESKK